MDDIQKIILTGRLVRDPERFQTKTGKSVASFSIASNRSHTTESGERKKKVAFTEWTFYSGMADTILANARKGSFLLCEGVLDHQTWIDPKTNKEMRRLRFEGRHFQFLSPNQRQEDPVQSTQTTMELAQQLESKKAPPTPPTEEWYP